MVLLGGGGRLVGLGLCIDGGSEKAGFFAGNKVWLVNL